MHSRPTRGVIRYSINFGHPAAKKNPFLSRKLIANIPDHVLETAGPLFRYVFSVSGSRLFKEEIHQGRIPHKNRREDPLWGVYSPGRWRFRRGKVKVMQIRAPRRRLYRGGPVVREYTVPWDPALPETDSAVPTTLGRKLNRRRCEFSTFHPGLTPIANTPLGCTW